MDDILIPAFDVENQAMTEDMTIQYQLPDFMSQRFGRLLRLSLADYFSGRYRKSVKIYLSTETILVYKKLYHFIQDKKLNPVRLNYWT
jgi:hypothetical protein